MMRRALALAVCAAVVGGGVGSSALAAPKVKPVCNLVADPSGDANGFVVTDTPLPNDPQLDIVGGDIASNKKLLTGVIRLAAVGTDSTSPTGRTYYVNFTINGTKVFLDAVMDRSGNVTYEAGDFSGPNGQRNTIEEVTGVMDSAKKEIRISASVRTWSESAKSGAAIAGLDLLAQRFIGDPAAGGATPTADEATSEATYKAGAASCVPVGK